MYLTAAQIEAAVASGSVQINPFSRALMKPASYVLRLGDRMMVWRRKNEVLECYSRVAASELESVAPEESRFLLEPRQFALAATLERVQLSLSHAAVMFGLSHLARFGLCVNMSSLLVSPGYQGQLTVELFNMSERRLALRVGMPVCHFAVMHSDGKVQTADLPLQHSIYQNQDAPQLPQLYEEFEHILGAL